jgi:hypothetical protein
LKKGQRQCQREKKKIIRTKNYRSSCVLGTPFAREAVSSAVAQAMPALTKDQQMLAIRIFVGGGVLLHAGAFG